MTGPIWFNNDIGGIYGIAGSSDIYRVAGRSTASDSGYLEIATSDDGTEPIYVRQYSNNSTEGDPSDPFSALGLKRTLTLLDASGNTILPGSLTTGESYSTTLSIHGGDSGYSRIENSTDSTVTSRIKLTESGIVNIDMAKLGLGAYDATTKTSDSLIQYNESEQCIEFVFN